MLIIQLLAEHLHGEDFWSVDEGEDSLEAHRADNFVLHLSEPVRRTCKSVKLGEVQLEVARHFFGCELTEDLHKLLRQ